MQILQKKVPIAYSPLFTALNAVFLASMGLLGHVVVTGPASLRWIWSALLIVLVTGAILQFGSRRVLFYRGFDTLAYGMAAIVFASLAWSVTIYAWGGQYKTIAGLMIAGMLLAFGALAFFKDQRNPQRTTMPSATGRLDAESGMIVDRWYAKKPPQNDGRLSAASSTLVRLSPLIGGLTLMFVRGLPIRAETLVLLPASVFFAAIVTLFAALSTSFLVATARWEREHGKRIYVER